jgi:hypothetical protein
MANPVILIDISPGKYLNNVHPLRLRLPILLTELPMAYLPGLEKKLMKILLKINSSLKRCIGM